MLTKREVILFILAVLCLFLPLPSFSQQNVQIEQGFGFLDVATPSVALIATTTPVLIGTVPAGTKNIYITAFYQDVLVGHVNDLAQSATEWTAAWKIQAGTTIKIDGIFTRNPNIWVLANTATATIKIAAWGTQ
jgi:hypothetical protein